MREFKLNKEVILLLFPFLFTSAINFLSTWYNFQLKHNDIYIKAIEKNRNDIIESEIEKKFLDDLIKLNDNIIKRKPRILNLYKTLEKEKIKESDKKFLFNSLMDLSNDLGSIQAYKNLKFPDSLKINMLNNYLNTEKEFINSILKNHKNDSILLKYLEYQSTEMNSSKISNKIDEIKLQFNKDDDEQTKKIAGSFNGIAYLNLLMFIMSILGILYLIYYSIKNKIFSR